MVLEDSPTPSPGGAAPPEGGDLKTKKLAEPMSPSPSGKVPKAEGGGFVNERLDASIPIGILLEERVIECRKKS